MKKRIIPAILAALILLSTFSVSAGGVIIGDVSGDDKVNNRDILVLMQKVRGNEPFGFVEEAADFNGDGEVNFKDVTQFVSARAERLSVLASPELPESPYGIEPVVLTAADVEVYEGTSSVTVPVIVSNLPEDRGIASIGFGVEISGKASVESIECSLSTGQSKQFEDRFIWVDDVQGIFEEDTQIATITFKISPDVKAGEHFVVKLKPSSDVDDCVTFQNIGKYPASVGALAPYTSNINVTSDKVPVSADYTSGDWGYTVSNGTATITKYTGSATNVTIPSVIGGYSVTAIGERAFYYCTSLTSVTIPDSVTTIGKSAFDSCTSLTSVTIGDSVTSIGKYAFYECTSLTSVTIPDSVTSIGDYAFCRCTSLTSVTIPDSVTTIGDDAFSYCTKLTSVTIPDSVTTIGISAFSNCTSLTSIDVDPNNASYKSIDGILYSKDGKTLVTCPGGKMSVTIPDSVTSIGRSAFRGCTSLTSVTIPDSVTTIGSDAFWNCTSLTRVTIPDSVTTIGDFAFSGCTSLTSVTIPDSVTSIGSGAFYDSTSLETVYFGGSEEQWNAISIGNYNDPLLNAKIIFNFDGSIVLPGDVNGDGKLNAKDVIALMKHLVGTTPANFVESAADFDANGKLNAKDVIAIMKHLVSAS